MRKLFVFQLLILYSITAFPQALRTINYNYIYRAAEEFSFNWKIVHGNNQIEAYYSLERTNDNINLAEYDILWEIRKDLGEKEGIALTNVIYDQSFESTKSGKVILNNEATGQYVVAKITNATKKRMWIYSKQVPQTPVPYYSINNKPAVKTYVLINDSVSLNGFDSTKPIIVSYYNDEFPSAAPPFSTAQARVASVIKSDSTFTSTIEKPIAFTRKGLYLVQQDTASSLGTAFRIENDYPKLAKIESLAGPLIYICTKQEYEKLRAAKNDKAQFDKIILSITGNSDRAKIFMRNYFRNVEMANRYFSSYKEGWKTDRGMIFIIFGLPEEVYLFGDREVWEYKNNAFSGRFTFVKSATLFDPENYVLIREKSYQDKWYEMIDLWRKAQF
jgi:GWxTD domain-containing protein